VSTLRLRSLSLSTASKTGGRVGGNDWSTSRDAGDDVADEAADGDWLPAPLASGSGGIATGSEVEGQGGGDGQYVSPSYKSE
jgi:hypothetical protein